MGKDLKELYEESLRCNKCGFCQATCPIYRELKDEGSVARGRLRLVRAVVDGELPASPNYAAKIFRCTMCASCNITCPSGVKVDDILLAAREDLGRRSLVPEPLVHLADTISRSHNISGEDNAGRLMWSQNLAVIPEGLRESRGADTIYFTGCVASFFPTSYRIPQAFAEVLDRAGESFTLLGGEEWCCGYPLLMAGLTEKAQELIRHNLERVREIGAKRLVTTCPSCYHAWTHLYPEVVGGVLDFEVLHSTQFLERLVAEERLRFKEMAERVTYHDPCDLGRKNLLFEAPRRLIKGIPGMELVEMKENRENALCCGGGGNLETFEPELAAAVAKRRLGQALDTKAGAIVSACQQCERTLSAAARRERQRVRVMDITELVRRAMADGGSR